ncbi:hypothetical protein GCM10029992_58880 [Glycomyces albus]
MGAMRKAGVWLGLIEDEEDRGYGTAYEENDEFAEERPVRSRQTQRTTGRLGREGDATSAAPSASSTAAPVR